MSDDERQMKPVVIDYIEQWFKTVTMADMVCRATMDKSVFQYLKEELEKEQIGNESRA